MAKARRNITQLMKDNRDTRPLNCTCGGKEHNQETPCYVSYPRNGKTTTKRQCRAHYDEKAPQVSHKRRQKNAELLAMLGFSV